MSRKKVKLQWIANDAARRATFKKRRRGLMKKVQELSILCNIKACAVVYGPYEPQPEVWPSAEEAAALLHSFRGMPEHEQGRRRMDQESFLRQRTEKLREQIEKEKKVAREIQVELLMSDCLKAVRRVEDLGMEETTALGCLVEMKLKEVQARIEFLRGQHQADPAVASAVEASPPPPPMHLKPLSQPPVLPPPSPVQYQFSNSYVPPPLPAQPPLYPPMEVVANNKHLAELHAPAMAANTRPIPRTNLIDHAAAGAAAEGGRRPDWLMEMMGPYSHLFYEGEGLVPPPLVDDTRNVSSWMIDPYFPFN